MIESRVRALLPDYVADRLPADQHAEVSQAIAGSARLQEELKIARAYHAACTGLSQVEPPADLALRISRTIVTQQMARSSRQSTPRAAPFRLSWEVAGLALTCIMLLLVYGPVPPPHKKVVPDVIPTPVTAQPSAERVEPDSPVPQHKPRTAVDRQTEAPAPKKELPAEHPPVQPAPKVVQADPPDAGAAITDHHETKMVRPSPSFAPRAKASRSAVPGAEIPTSTFMEASSAELQRSIDATPAAAQQSLAQTHPSAGTAAGSTAFSDESSEQSMQEQEFAGSAMQSRREHPAAHTQWIIALGMPPDLPHTEKSKDGSSLSRARTMAASPAAPRQNESADFEELLGKIEKVLRRYDRRALRQPRLRDSDPVQFLFEIDAADLEECRTALGELGRLGAPSSPSADHIGRLRMTLAVMRH